MNGEAGSGDRAVQVGDRVSYYSGAGLFYEAVVASIPASYQGCSAYGCDWFYKVLTPEEQ